MRSSRSAAFLAFTGLTLPFGLAVHLIAELAGVGEGAHFLERHAYMLALGVAGLGALAIVARATRTLRGLVALLPDRGRGWRFFALSLTTQLGIAASTQAGEGLTIPAQDVLTILVAGIVAAAFGALICGFFAGRLLALVLQLFAYVRFGGDALVRASAPFAAPRHPAHAFAPNVLSRPPPQRG